MRLRNVPYAKDIINNNPNISVLNPMDYKGKWVKSFGLNKLEIEVGCGKGKMLSLMAEDNKDNLYLGIEKFDSVICRAITRAIELDLSNLKFIRMDAEKLLDVFSDSEVDRVYLSFPDPWPKARHEKRRLTSPKFLELYKKILKEDGIIRLKTDNYDLYQYSLETMIPLLNNPKYGEYPMMDNDYTTEFEDKFRKLNQKIYYIEGKFNK